MQESRLQLRSSAAAHIPPKGPVYSRTFTPVKEQLHQKPFCQAGRCPPQSPPQTLRIAAVPSASALEMLHQAQTGHGCHIFPRKKALQAIAIMRRFLPHADRFLEACWKDAAGFPQAPFPGSDPPATHRPFHRKNGSPEILPSHRHQGFPSGPPVSCRSRSISSISSCSIVITQKRHADRPRKGGKDLLPPCQSTQSGSVVFCDMDLSFSKFTEIQITAQHIFRIWADQLHTLRRIHQPGQHMCPAGRIAVVCLILQQDLTVRIINFHIGAAVFHRPDLLAAKPVMDDHRLPDIRSLAVQLLHETAAVPAAWQLSLGQQFVIQDGLIQIQPDPVNLAVIELLQNEAVHRPLYARYSSGNSSLCFCSRHTDRRDVPDPDCSDKQNT